jgi:hypothetical protein
VARLAGVLLLVTVLLFNAWAVLALHYAPLTPPPTGDALALLLIVAASFALIRLKAAKAALTASVCPTLVLIWFLLLRPAEDRHWTSEYALPASVSIEGNAVHIRNIRNFQWKTESEAVPAYYDADFALDSASSVDLILSYWAGEAIAHVFVSFGFSDGRHLAISVETRRAVGQDYSALAGFFRNYELFYVVADERDLIGVRTDIRHESVYIYRIRPAVPDAPRLLLHSYLQRVQALAGAAAFYNTLTDNCTTNVITRANAAGPNAAALRYSWKLLASGYADSYAYDLGRLNQDLAFPELKRRSLITRPPGASITTTFSSDIRVGLP